MSSSCQGISRPRPVSTLTRQHSNSIGSAPQEMRQSLKAAVRKINRTSLPVINLGSNPATGASESAPGSDTLTVNNGQGGVSPGGSNTTQAPAVQSMVTPPQTPLSPVFSAISAEPLQPQLLTTTTTTTKPPTRDSPPPTPVPSHIDILGVSDRYSALADLDSAFSDPVNAPATTIDWGRSQSCKEEESAENAPGTESKTNAAVNEGQQVQVGSGSGIRSMSGSSTGSPPKVISTSPTARSMMAMYGTTGQPVVYSTQAMVNGYCMAPALYATQPTAHRVTPVSGNGGYVYHQNPAQPGTYPTVVHPGGFQGIPAYPGMVPQRVPAQGAGWGQMGGAVPLTNSSSHPCITSSQLSGQSPICLS